MTRVELAAENMAVRASFQAQILTDVLPEPVTNDAMEDMTTSCFEVDNWLITDSGPEADRSFGAKVTSVCGLIPGQGQISRIAIRESNVSPFAYQLDALGRWIATEDSYQEGTGLWTVSQGDPSLYLQVDSEISPVYVPAQVYDYGPYSADSVALPPSLDFTGSQWLRYSATDRQFPSLSLTMVVNLQGGEGAAFGLMSMEPRNPLEDDPEADTLATIGVFVRRGNLTLSIFDNEISFPLFVRQNRPIVVGLTLVQGLATLFLADTGKSAMSVLPITSPFLIDPYILLARSVAYSDESWGLVGQIYEIAIWDRSLSTEEITELLKAYADIYGVGRR